MNILFLVVVLVLCSGLIRLASALLLLAVGLAMIVASYGLGLFSSLRLWLRRHVFHRASWLAYQRTMAERNEAIKRLYPSW